MMNLINCSSSSFGMVSSGKINSRSDGYMTAYLSLSVKKSSLNEVSDSAELQIHFPSFFGITLRQTEIIAKKEKELFLIL